jgi:acyl carrier protein
MTLARADDLRQSILRTVTEILADITADWDLEFSGGIGPQTMLIADLAFESIDVVELVVALEERFGRRDLPFEELLMVDGRYVDDLSVAQIVDFLLAHVDEVEA